MDHYSLKQTVDKQRIDSYLFRHIKAMSTMSLSLHASLLVWHSNTQQLLGFLVYLRTIVQSKFNIGGKGKSTHHCPKQYKGNCRKRDTNDGSGNKYCVVYELYCSICGVVFLKNQTCSRCRRLPSSVMPFNMLIAFQASNAGPARGGNARLRSENVRLENERLGKPGGRRKGGDDPTRFLLNYTSTLMPPDPRLLSTIPVQNVRSSYHHMCCECH
jgi:hypothetical protein